MTARHLVKIRELAAKIDLGKKWPAGDDCPCLVRGTPKPRMDYPSLNIWNRKGLEEFPKSGKAVIEYKIERRTVTDRDGEITTDLCLEVKTIEPVEDKDGKISRKDTKDGKAKPLTVNFSFPLNGERPVAESPLSIRLKKKPLKPGGIAAVGGRGGRGASVSGRATALECLQNLNKYFDDRMRNGNGQFVGNQTGGADPNSMNAAYKQPKKKPLTVSGGATVGGALAGMAAGRIVGAGIDKVQSVGDRLARKAVAIAGA